jgi:hypothetical protein
MDDNATREDLPLFCARMGRTYDAVPGYQVLYRLTLSGVLPAERIGPRWMMLPGAEQALVAHYGLKLRQQPAAEAATATAAE